MRGALPADCGDAVSRGAAAQCGRRTLMASLLPRSCPLPSPPLLPSPHLPLPLPPCRRSGRPDGRQAGDGQPEAAHRGAQQAGHRLRGPPQGASLARPVEPPTHCFFLPALRHATALCPLTHAQVHASLLLPAGSAPCCSTAPPFSRHFVPPLPSTSCSISHLCLPRLPLPPPCCRALLTDLSDCVTNQGSAVAAEHYG